MTKVPTSGRSAVARVLAPRRGDAPKTPYFRKDERYPPPTLRRRSLRHATKRGRITGEPSTRPGKLPGDGSTPRNTIRKRAETSGKLPVRGPS